MLRESDLAFMRQQFNLTAPTVEEPVTFYRYARTIRGNKAAGTSDSVEYEPPDGTTIAAVVTPVSLSTQDAPGGQVTDGEITLQVRVDALPPIEDDGTTGTTGTQDPRTRAPTPSDRFVWKGAWYQPVRVSEPRVGGGTLFWFVRCERR